MKKRYNWLASIFILATLPLMAESLPNEGEEIALESQETAQYGSRKSNTVTLKDTRKRCKECRNEPDVLVVPEEIAIGNQKGVITPSVAPYTSHGPGIYASIDFIWWQTVLNGVQYAYNGTSDGSSDAPIGFSVEKGTLARGDFQFEPGFKVGMGRIFDHDGWDVGLEYTYLPASGEDSVEGMPRSETCDQGGTGAKTAVDVTTGDGEVDPMSLILGSGEWKQNYNVLDLSLGRNFFISKFLTLRPFVGFKGAWITEKFDLDFVPTGNTTDPRFPMGANRVLFYGQIDKQSMWGVGIRGGVNTVWHFNKNFGIYGDIAFTTLWSSFHVKQFDTITESIEGTYDTVRLDYKIRTVTPVIETGIGLAYIDWFSEDRYRIEGRLGWENQVWVDFNQMREMRSGDLTQQGLTLKLGMTF